MNKILSLTICAILLFSCNNESGSQKESSQNEPAAKVEAKLLNYAIVWEWITTDKQLVENNLIAINEEMNRLWKNGDLENAYWNNDSQVNKFENYPNICYFIKATSLDNVKSILDELVIVKKGIASYTVYPVGTMWLGRETETINERSITNSFAAVWSTEKALDPNADEALILKQAELMLNLYNSGAIENVYWDFENTYSAENNNGVSDFVFFVNVNAEEEARKLCDDLPLSKQGFVSYKLYPVGVFWMGKYE